MEKKLQLYIGVYGGVIRFMCFVYKTKTKIFKLKKSLVISHKIVKYFPKQKSWNTFHFLGFRISITTTSEYIYNRGNNPGNLCAGDIKQANR